MIHFLHASVIFCIHDMKACFKNTYATHTSSDFTRVYQTNPKLRDRQYLYLMVRKSFKQILSFMQCIEIFLTVYGFNPTNWPSFFSFPSRMPYFTSRSFQEQFQNTNKNQTIITYIRLKNTLDTTIQLSE